MARSAGNSIRERQIFMSNVEIIREWDADLFHQRVMTLEAEGYVARPETYQVIPEMNPETGVISHLRLIEMVRPTPGSKPSKPDPTGS
jgi:hypothetical protein